MKNPKNEIASDKWFVGIDPAVPGPDMTAFTEYTMTGILKTTMIAFWDCPECGAKCTGPHDEHVCNVDGSGTASSSSREAQKRWAEKMKQYNHIGDIFQQKISEEIDKSIRLRATGYRSLNPDECSHCGYKLDSQYHQNHCLKQLKEGTNGN